MTTDAQKPDAWGAEEHAEDAVQGSQGNRGRRAATPRAIPLAGWKDIVIRLYGSFLADRVMLVAAGATFYLLLALFPALAAFVSLYGFVADPTTVSDHVAFLGGLLPGGALDLLRGRLDALASQDRDALSFGFLLGLAFALWSANNGIKTLFDALNIAYEEREKRGFLQLNLASFAFTLGALLLGIFLLLSVGVVPAVLAFFRLGWLAETLIDWLRWPFLLGGILVGIALIYRFGPSREPARWRWLSAGAVVATLCWVAMSVGFSFYLENFANYDATYGSLGAVIGFMMWTWLSVIILLIGAELNSEIEHQTAQDTTTGPPMPMGERGAVKVDTLGDAVT